MEEIKIEFEEYLKSVVNSYSTKAESAFDTPSILPTVNAKSRDFNSKAQSKIKELATKYNVPELNLKIELSSIQIIYYDKVILPHF